MLSPVRAAPRHRREPELRSSRGRLHGCSRLSSLRWQSGLPLVKRRMAECLRTYLRGWDHKCRCRHRYCLAALVVLRRGGYRAAHQHACDSCRDVDVGGPDVSWRACELRVVG